MLISAQLKNLFQKVQQIFPVFILLSTFYFLFSVPPAFAQNNSITPPPNPYIAPSMNSDVPQNLHTWTQSVMIEVLSSASCQLSGIDPSNPTSKCLGVDQKTGKLGFVENGGGLIGIMGNQIAQLYHPPLHTSDYIAYLSSNFGIAKPAYAQGVGFAGISPLTELWKVFRNLTYLLFVIVFILIGLAIMLRIKIDPRTVMSIENQIPKIVIGIILVTFSFAISGLAIDMMWFSTYVGVNVISSADTSAKPPLATTVTNQIYTPPIGFVNELYNKGTGGILNVTYDGSRSIQTIISNLFAPKNAYQLFWPGAEGSPGCSFFDVGCWLGQTVGSKIGEILSHIIGWLLGWVFGILGFLVILIAVLFALFRLWFALIKAYIMVLLDVVLGPLWIVAGLVPGSPIGFGAWFRDLIADLSAFPVVIFMLMMGKVMMEAFRAASAAPGNIFVPPLIGNPASLETISPLIALGIIWLTPGITEIVRDVIKAPQFKYGGAIGQSLGAGAAVPGRVGSGFANQMFGVHYGKGGMTAEGGTLGKFMRAFGFAH